MPYWMINCMCLKKLWLLTCLLINCWKLSWLCLISCFDSPKVPRMPDNLNVIVWELTLSCESEVLMADYLPPLPSAIGLRCARLLVRIWARPTLFGGTDRRSFPADRADNPKGYLMRRGSHVSVWKAGFQWVCEEIGLALPIVLVNPLFRPIEWGDTAFVEISQMCE